MVPIGYGTGASYATVEKTFGRDAAFVVLAIGVVGVVAWRIRKRRAPAGDRS